MTTATRETLKGLFKMDPSITADQVRTCFLVLNGSPDVLHGHGDIDRILSRKEAAEILGCGPKRVDDLTRRGVLKRFYFPGCSRASGIPRSSVESVMLAGVL